MQLQDLVRLVVPEVVLRTGFGVVAIGFSLNNVTCPSRAFPNPQETIVLPTEVSLAFLPALQDASASVSLRCCRRLCSFSPNDPLQVTSQANDRRRTPRHKALHNKGPTGLQAVSLTIHLHDDEVRGEDSSLGDNACNSFPV